MPFHVGELLGLGSALLFSAPTDIRHTPAPASSALPAVRHARCASGCCGARSTRARTRRTTMENQKNDVTEVETRDEELFAVEEQLTVDVPLEIRAGATNKYPCCKRAA
jgi:hypothetical protein